MNSSSCAYCKKLYREDIKRFQNIDTVQDTLLYLVLAQLDSLDGIEDTNFSSTSMIKDRYATFRGSPQDILLLNFVSTLMSEPNTLYIIVMIVLIHSCTY